MKLYFYRSLTLFWLALLPQLGHSSTLLNSTLESLRETKTVAFDGVPLLSGRLLAEFYARRGNALVWTTPARVAELLHLTHESQTEGFAPEDFHVATLRALSAPDALNSLAEPARIAADLKLSDALLRYVHHTRFGKLDPLEVDPQYNDRDPVPASLLLKDMLGAVDAVDMQGFLATRQQHPFWYNALKEALTQFIPQADIADLPPLASGANLVKGSRDPRIPLLRERLRILNGHKSTAFTLPDADLFDAQLYAEVVAFQRRFGLFPDGVIGPTTIATLNQPVDVEKADRIRINLERMRWLFNDLASDYVFVDVANYQAHVVRDGAIAWSTRVIVGQTDSQTPMFRDTMNHLVLNPTWTVPISIQKTMGQVSANYMVVDRQTGRKSNGGNVSNYRRYSVIQPPGPKNALGRVKFMFPNRHSVYLHDTPNKSLFARSSRALSHGCVRVENPVKLAEILLHESDWDRARIDQVLDGSKTRYVNLQQGLPVLLYYLTAYANAPGKVSFRPDMYQRDQRVKELFAAPVLSARIAFPDAKMLPLVAPPAPVIMPAEDDGTDDAADEEQLQEVNKKPPSPLPAPQEPVRLTQMEN
ncbi:L,D-transpeptidase family protein [Chromatium okenii]|uniref:Murein L,D-transpeptidase n=1 Tax=Chromatium okenii TaxID=61644 RepID=A0A2S7XPG5_9GAMM|nr:L,D-transpeptidase family protein [Chromatium okenii]PQJ95629.1 murein L,D-transpeptidase [Chromatium okenii]